MTVSMNFTVHLVFGGEKQSNYCKIFNKSWLIHVAQGRLIRVAGGVAGNFQRNQGPQLRGMTVLILDWKYFKIRTVI